MIKISVLLPMVPGVLLTLFVMLRICTLMIFPFIRRKVLTVLEVELKLLKPKEQESLTST